MMTTALETRRAPAIGFVPQTFDADAGTVDVTLTTGAPVQRGGHIEVLAIGPENVEFAQRIPLLDSHRQTSIADIKGSVSNIRFEPGAIDSGIVEPGGDRRAERRAQHPRAACLRLGTDRMDDQEEAPELDRANRRPASGTHQERQKGSEFNR